MLGIELQKLNVHLVIRWQLTKIKIPVAEITGVTLGDTYAGSEKAAVRIGLPYGTTDRVIIKTTSRTYILFTTNPEAIISQLQDIVVV